MKRLSPTLEGFKTAFRYPLLGLAELAWRWSFGGAVAALLFVSFFEYLDTLPVTGGDRFLLNTGHPFLVSRALNHILHGSAPRVVAAFLVGGVALAIAWILVASWGRAVTLKNLLASIRGDDGVPFHLRSIMALNGLRVGATVAALVGCVGGLVLGSLASPEKNPAPGVAFLVFLLIILLTWTAWALINWVLSFAAIFVVARGEDAFGAIAATADLCRNRTGAVFSASSWFGMAHLVALFIFGWVAGLPLMVAGILPRGLVLGGLIVASLLYFALVDWLYIGRLAAYTWIAEVPEPVVAPITPAQIRFTLPPETRVDPDDLILSDVPAL